MEVALHASLIERRAGAIPKLMGDMQHLETASVCFPQHEHHHRKAVAELDASRSSTFQSIRKQTMCKSLWPNCRLAIWTEQLDRGTDSGREWVKE